MRYSGAVKDPIVQAGASVLRAKAKPVLKKDVGSERIQKVIAAMKKALAKEEFGVAIAAPQIGESLRIFVVAGRVFEEEQEHPKENGLASPAREGDPEAQDEETRGPFRKDAPADRVFINPEITRLSRKKAEMSEGCLSVRGKYGTVLRHEKASLKAWDESGRPVSYNASGLLGHIFQHECDHLDGILYIDKAVQLEEDDDMKSARVKLKEKHGV